MMKTVQTLCVLTALGLSGVAAPALANDSTAQMKTGGLEFVQTDDIEMAEEKLYVSPEKVTVEYRFHNKAAKDIEALVAFPMPDIAGGTELNVSVDLDAGDNFLGFTVNQDGRDIKPELQQQALVYGVDLTADLKAMSIPLVPNSNVSNAALEALQADKLERLKTLGLIRIEQWDDGNGMKDHPTAQWTLRSVYWWKTTYPAGKDVIVKHSYKTSVGGTVDITYLDENGQPKGEQWDDYLKRYCLDDSMVKVAQKSRKAGLANKGPLYVENWISYILMTGNNWAGPIGKFTLTVDKGKPESIVSFCGEGLKKTGPTTFQMQKTDFYPERDLEILLLVPPNFDQQ
jgi:hypothetical protein